MLVAAGGPRRVPLRSLWTLHRAILDLGNEAARAGLNQTLPEIRGYPDPQVGLSAAGLPMALHELASTGAIEFVGEGWDCHLQAAEEAIRNHRRKLMGLDPALAQLVYLAGTNWSTLALTAEKNWARALESVARRRASAIPNRRQPLVALARCSAITDTPRRAGAASTR